MYKGKLLRNFAVVGLNLVIFYFLIRWCTHNIQLDILARQIARLPATAIVLTLALNLVAIAFYALRLGVLLGERFRTSLSTTFLGFGLNSILPFRLGELARLYYAKRYLLIPTTSLFAASLVEKLFDLSALAVLATVVITLSSIQVIHKSVVIALIAMVTAGYVAVLSYRRLAHYVERTAGTSVRMQALLAAFHQQSRLHHVHQIVRYTLLIWTLNTIVVYIAFSGFLPDYSIGVLDSIALLLISALAIAIPTAPAGLGLFEAGIVAYLTQVRRAPPELALAAAVVFHLAVMLPQLVVVSWLMVRFQRMRGKEEAPRRE